MLEWLSSGLLNWSPWQILAYTLVTTHITVVSVTVYLHRYSSHRALDLHPALKHFFRFWLWLATGMETKQWTAVHRKHHALCETPDDPHSPVQQGLRAILWGQTEAYQKEAKRQDTLDQYGSGTPDDWIERHVYQAHSRYGIVSMLLINLTLFGAIGITVWAVQMVWIPLLGGVINGIGHYWGYRNFECPDAARNIVPWGILIGGEELHNNHHTYANSAKLSAKAWEFDIGWMWIRIFQLLGLARPLGRGPSYEQTAQAAALLTTDAARALANDRFNVMARYAKTVVAPTVAEHRGAPEVDARDWRGAKKVLCRTESLLSDAHRAKLQSLIQVPELRTVYELKTRLQEIWDQRSGDLEAMSESLRRWCRDAEATGSSALQDYVSFLKTYRLPGSAAPALT